MERALVDFGAEESYARASTWFAEHYGYDIGRTTIQRVVKEHAVAAETFVANTLAAYATGYQQSLAERPGANTILVEMDGCEIRTGQLEKTRGRRKTAVRGLPVRQRPSTWRDVRLAFARELSSVTKTYVPRQGCGLVVRVARSGSIAASRLGSQNPDTTPCSISLFGHGLKVVCHTT